MVSLLRQRIQPLTICKVRAHTHVLGNDEADILAKDKTKKPHRLPSLQCFFYDFLFFIQVAPLKHILKPIHPDVE
jgi:hypothetical protein